jgi:hypothetical protein
MMDDDIEKLIRIEIPSCALAASASSPSGWCLNLFRDETLALLRSSPRWRSCNELLGRAAMRSNDRYGSHSAEIPHRVEREQAADVETFHVPKGHEIASLTFSHDSRNLVATVKTRKLMRTVNGASRLPGRKKLEGVT